MNMSAKKLQYTSLFLGVLLTVTLIVNTAMTTYIMYTSSFTASMDEGQGEKIDVAINADVGRPSPLEFLWRALKGWTTAWFVGGQQRENATTSIIIQVTGSNVASTATVNWYIEAEDSLSSGTPYRFVEGNGTQVTVGGASHQASDQRSIEGHLEAMGLSTDAGHTIDYYVYVEAQATGAVSGETLTSEIVKTKFDTVTYSYGTEVQVSGKTQGNVKDYEIKNGGTFSNAVTQTPFMNDPNSYESGLLLYPAANYFDIPQGATITDAYLRLKAGTSAGSSSTICTVTIRAEKKGLYYNQQCASAADFDARNRTTSEVVWGVPAWTGGNWYNSPDISSVIQEVVNENTWTGSYRCIQVFLEDTTGDYDISQYRHYKHRDSATADAPLIYITYVTYGASWYTVPPLSVIDLPISLDLMAYAAVAAAALAIYLSKKEKKKR